MFQDIIRNRAYVNKWIALSNEIKYLKYKKSREGITNISNSTKIHINDTRYI